MSEFTTIQITKEVRDKLDLCKGTNNLSYNDIVEKLLQQSGGVIVEDTIEIGREQVAFSLKYFDGDGGSKVRDITFRDLAAASVGDWFFVTDSVVGNDWVNSRARVVSKDSMDVILLVEEFTSSSSIKSVVHVELF